MNRRAFLSSGLAAAMVIPRSRAAGERVNHRLPASDVHYRRVRSYIEDVPVPEYRLSLIHI